MDSTTPPTVFYQPEGSYHFAQDALLLRDRFAAALSRLDSPVFMDIGTGCGVIGLGALAAVPSSRCVLIEREQVLADAARLNAEKLGLEERCRIICGDISDRSTLESARTAGEEIAGLPPHRKRAFDAAVCNPPWRKLSGGMLPPPGLRRRALFGDAETPALFFGFAGALLRDGGRLCTISDAARLPEWLTALKAAKLDPVAMQSVHPRISASAAFMLTDAIRCSKRPFSVDAPIILCPDADRIVQGQ